MSPTLNLLCAGAAQGLIKALQPEFQARTGALLAGRFGAVGAMKEALLAGVPCDLMIVTTVLVDSLVASGRLRADARANLGRVHTGIAVRSGTPHPDVSTPQALEAALRAADSIFFPDPQRATAGIHFAGVMRQLGVLDLLRPRFRTFPSGAVTMSVLAASPAANPIGCSQVTEILYTEGVELVGPLPARFELATTYTAAVARQAAEPSLSEQLLELLVAGSTRPLREAGGFEV